MTAVDLFAVRSTLWACIYLPEIRQQHRSTKVSAAGLREASAIVWWVSEATRIEEAVLWSQVASSGGPAANRCLLCTVSTAWRCIPSGPPGRIERKACHHHPIRSHIGASCTISHLQHDLAGCHVPLDAGAGPWLHHGHGVLDGNPASTRGCD